METAHQLCQLAVYGIGLGSIIVGSLAKLDRNHDNQDGWPVNVTLILAGLFIVFGFTFL